MIFVNYKTYEEATGERAVSLTKILENVAQEAQIKIIPVVQAVDIKEVIAATTLEVWTQKIDPVEFGAHTGSIVPEAVLEDGAMGTFLNHSEAKFANFDELAKASDRAKEAGLKTLIFAKDLEELKNVCSLNPNFVAYEPPELIGSTSTSVAEARPEIISEAHAAANAAGIPLIVGAGVHSQNDVRKCLELGAVGVAVATDIVKAENPAKELLDLIEGFK
ncbi:MAG: Triosephosphate isomerase [Candidatus Woesebacteria bacterium GW2011_GWB1_45_5]|uniref:Triosephosphate isomerase n=1 Tax=Candidatus Woesebacteria bacterium GW2011_GWB1_45_5 TaxID=1618581 RepID=A0A0G1MPA9_9BACT|nr:MAG: Triosephosphate isomerase [Candidatus Woesebacteria bacterium GW2011_GWB1_45_5]